MIGKKIIQALTGLLTTIIVMVGIMFILWPTIDIPVLIQANNELVSRYGFGGHLFMILLMLLLVNIFIPFKFSFPISFLPMFSNLNIDQSIQVGNKFGSPAMYFLILGIWLLGSFAGGLVSRGGLKSGSTSSGLAFLILDLLFSILAVSFDWNIAGISGFLLFFVMFFFVMILGSFVIVEVIGLVGGGLGGIFGKVLLSGDKKKKDSVSLSD